MSKLAQLIETRLKRNSQGQTLIDVYTTLEKLAREEYHPKISYHWCARWNDFFETGNWITKPDSLDAVEILIRMEKAFQLTIPDDDAERMETIGQTVRYLWDKSDSI